MTTKARSSRAGWSAAVVVSPLVAALAAGSILWAGSNDPRAAAQEASGQSQVVEVVGTGPSATASVSSADATTKELRATLKKLERKIDRAKQDAKQAAVGGGTVNAGSGVSTEVAQPAPAPVPAPAPAPAPADTWTGSSGG